MAKIRTHYDNLRVARNAPDSVIKAAYKALCQTYHPDKFQGSNAEAERIMKLINTSYAVLIDPVKRAEHDAWIREKEAAANQRHEKATFGETGEATEQTYQKQEVVNSHHEWRRFFARILDYFIFNLLLLIVFFIWLAIGQPLPNVMANSIFSSAEPEVWLIFVSTFFWVILESICLSIFGTTIGKTLFRLRLVSNNNKSNYWRRSLTVWLKGMGAGFYILSIIFMLKAAENLKKTGQTAWDRDAGFSVEAEPLSILRGASLTVLIVLLIVANGIIWEIEKHTASSQQPKQQVQDVQNVPQVTPQDTFQRAVNLDKLGQYVEALPLYQRLAEQGNSDSQFNLGLMYSKGRGVAQDDKQAVYWYNKAAEQGNAHAQNNLGLMYNQGKGAAQDDKQAVYWYNKAAEQGNAHAQFNLGFMYDQGKGIAQNDKQAVYWYNKAAEQGNSDSQYNLGLMYSKGRGVAQDDNQAVYWLNKAAEQGNSVAIAAIKLIHTFATEQPKQQEPLKSWQRDWGNGIITTVFFEPCPSTMLTSKGYSYALFSSIPLSRLKLRSDAYFFSGDRAATVIGCWIKKEGDLIHAIMTRKKDGKTWEQDFNMTDGNWTSQGDSKSANEAINRQEHMGGEATAKMIDTNVAEMENQNAINKNHEITFQPDDGNPHGHYVGQYLICDDGYKAEGSKCFKLPTSPEYGHYVGQYLICDDGYKAEGSKCFKLPPSPEYGHYVGQYLICDDGYKAEGSKCFKLPPSPEYGHYVGQYLICDNGYKAEGSKCLKLPPLTR